MTDQAREGVVLGIGLDSNSIQKLIDSVQALIAKLSEQVIEVKAEVETGEAVHDIEEVGDAFAETEQDAEDFGDAAEEAVEGTSDGLNQLQGLLQSVGSLFAGIGALAFFKKTIDSAAELEDSLNRVRTVLQATGNASAATLERVKNLALGFQAVTRFSAASILEAQSRLLGLGVSVGQLGEATEAVLNIATVLGREARDVANAVGKTLKGQAGALAEYGIVVDQAVFQQDRFKATIDAVNKSFANAAKGDVNTFSGRVSLLSDTFNDLLATIGSIFTESPVLIDLLVFLRDTVSAVNEWIKTNPVLAKTIAFVAVGVAGLAAGAGLLKTVLVMAPVIKATVTAMMSFSVQATVMSASAKNLTISMAQLKTAGIAAGAAIGTAFVGLAAAGLAAAYAETKRLEAEIERLEAQMATDYEAFQRQRITKSIEAGLEALKRGQLEEVERRRQIAREAGGVLEYDRTILQAQKEINEELAKRRDEISGELLGRRELFAVLREELFKIKETTLETSQVNQAAFRGLQQSTYEYQQQLERLANTLDPDKPYLWQKAVQEADTQLTAFIGNFQKLELAEDGSSRALTSIGKLILKSVESTDEMVKATEQNADSYAQTLDRARDLKLLNDQQYLTQLQQFTALTNQLNRAKKMQDIANKRLVLERIRTDLEKTAAPIAQQVADAEERIAAQKQAQAQWEDRRLKAIETVVELRQDIIDLQSEETNSLKDQMRLVTRRYDTELAAARKAGESTEVQQELELRYVKDRLGLEQQIIEARRNAQEEFVEQIEDSRARIMDYIDEVDERIRRAQGEGALVDIEEQIAKARELVKDVTDQDIGAGLLKAAGANLQQSLEELDKGIMQQKGIVAERNQALGALNEEYQQERKDLLDRLKIDQASGSERRRALEELNDRYRDRGVELKSELADAEAELKRQMNLRQQSNDLIQQEINVMEQQIQARLQELAIQKQRVEREQLLEDLASAGLIATDAMLASQTNEQLKQLLSQLQAQQARLDREVLAAGQPVAGAAVGAVVAPSEVVPTAVPAVPQETLDQFAQAAERMAEIATIDSAFEQITVGLDDVVQAQTQFNETLEDFSSTAVSKLTEMTNGINTMNRRLSAMNKRIAAIEVSASEEDDYESQGLSKG